MKSKPVILLGISLLIAGASARAAESGEALYKAKCSACHGAAGEGKPAMKAPALKGTKLDVNQITDRLTQGQPGSKAPHNKGLSGLKGEQAKTIAEYVKKL